MVINYASRAVRNTIIVIAFNVLGGLLGYLLRLLFARNLTPAEYGLFYVIYAFIGLFSLCRSLGLNEALVKYLAQYEVQKRWGMIKAAIQRVVKLQLISAVSLGILFMLLSEFLGTYYFKDPAAANLLRLLTIMFILMVFGDVIKFIFQGLQKMVFAASVNPLKMSLIIVIGWFLLEKGFGIYGVALAYVLAYVLLPFFYYRAFYKNVKWNIKAPKMGSKLTKTLLQFGIPVTISLAGYMIIEYTDVLILNYFRDLVEVGLYNVAMPTSKLLFYFSGAVGIVVFPLVTELWTKKLKERLVSGVQKIYVYMMLLLVPITVIIFAFPEAIIQLLFGNEYGGAAYALQILIVGSLAFCLFSLNTNVFAGIGKPEITSRILLGGAAYNIIASILLIPRLGMAGAAYATASAYLILFAFSCLYTWKLAGIQLPWGKLVQVFIAGLGLLGMAALIKHQVQWDPIAELIVSFSCGMIVYLGLVAFMKIVRTKEVLDIVQATMKNRLK